MNNRFEDSDQQAFDRAFERTSSNPASRLQVRARREIALGLGSLAAVVVLAFALVGPWLMRSAGPASPEDPAGPAVSVSTSWLPGFPAYRGTTQYVTGIALGDSFVVATVDGHQIWYGDGESWTEADTSALTGMYIARLVTYAGGVMAFGQKAEAWDAQQWFTGIEIAISPDGKTWTRIPESDLPVFDRAQFMTAASGPAGVVVAGEVVTGEYDRHSFSPQSFTWRSNDGIHWQMSDAIPDWDQWGGALVGGNKGYVAYAVNGLAGASTDGLHWVPNGDQIIYGTRNQQVLALPDGFVAMGTCGGDDWLSTHGNEWHSIGDEVPFQRCEATYAGDGKRVVALTLDGLWQTTNGLIWTQVADLADTDAAPAGTIVVGPRGVIVSPNAVKWSFIPAPEN